VPPCLGRPSGGGSPWSLAVLAPTPGAARKGDPPCSMWGGCYGLKRHDVTGTDRDSLGI
jgi:hypothetical protein